MGLKNVEPHTVDWRLISKSSRRKVDASASRSWNDLLSDNCMLYPSIKTRIPFMSAGKESLSHICSPLRSLKESNACPPSPGIPIQL
jgi:hypothetical protein